MDSSRTLLGGGKSLPSKGEIEKGKKNGHAVQGGRFTRKGKIRGRTRSAPSIEAFNIGGVRTVEGGNWEKFTAKVCKTREVAGERQQGGKRPIIRKKKIQDRGQWLCLGRGMEITPGGREKKR